MLKFLHKFLHRNQTPDPTKKLHPDNIQSQAIDITDSVWDTYRVAYLDHYYHKDFVKTKPRKLRKMYPLANMHYLESGPVFDWIHDMIHYWELMAVVNYNIYYVRHILEVNHADNFYEITTHETLYKDLRAYLLNKQKKPFPYPECYVDNKHGRIILPGDEQHFLLPEKDMFNSTKYDNKTAWSDFVTYLMKKKGLWHPKPKLKVHYDNTLKY